MIPATEPIPDDPLEWRPQLPRPTHGMPTVHDPIVEPEWEGTHVILHFAAPASGDAGPTIRMIDKDGEEATGPDSRLVEELSAAIMALDAVIDGVLTNQATRSGEGAAIITSPKVGRFNLVTARRGELEVRGPTVEHDRPDAVAFVAIDLLQVDGQPLLDTPLLERKRLLESIVAPSELVRVSPFTRPPIDPWLASWKSAGFAGAVAKAANSRYRPGTYTEEWVVVKQLQRRG